MCRVMLQCVGHIKARSRVIQTLFSVFLMPQALTLLGERESETLGRGI